MFENLSNKLDRAFKVLKGQGRITEINVASTIKEIRRALIDADVSYKVAKEITSTNVIMMMLELIPLWLCTQC